MIIKIFCFFIILLQIGKTSFNIINDQTSNSEVTSWDSAFQTFGVVSKLCPLGTRYYMYPDIQQPIRYFFSRGEIAETNILFLLIFIEISYQEKSVKALLLLNQDDNWHQYEQYFDILSYEGKWFQHLIYYDDQEKIVMMQIRWGENQLLQYFFPYTKLINIEFTFTVGGVYNCVHPISNQELTLITFPGSLQSVYSSLVLDLSNSWQYFFENICSNVNTVQQGGLDLIPSNKYQIFINTKNLLYYKVTFWVKIDIMNLDIDHEITIIRISANRFTSNFQQTGSNSFIIKYFYASKSQTWIANIYYYSYPVPVIRIFQQNQDPYLREDCFNLNQELLSSWHYISIEYTEKNEINLSFQNLLEGKYIYQVYTHVFQFSNIYYRLLFGGASLDQNTLPMSIALISYYDCDQSEIKCHQSCQTCFGPMANQCLSCPQESNRVFEAKENSCKCQMWYFENENFECVYSQYDNIIISMEDQDGDEDDFDEFCNFGQFSYKQTCFQCPSAKQKNSIICSECLMRPTDWIVKNASCQDTYHLYNNSLKNNYVKRSSNSQNQNNYFVLQNEQLIHCEGCKICFDKNQISCFKSKNYQHLGQETFIQCIEGYIQKNQQCVLELNINQNLLSQCQKGCQKCQNNICLACSNNKENLFIDLKGQCQKCSILNCKYCFEFNSLNLQENSIFMILTQNIQADDFIIGCALCVTGYYYSFYQQQCIKNSNPINLLFYLNEENEQNIYQSYFQEKSNQFQEIVYCQNIIPHCFTCVYNYLGLQLCTQCEIGYFSNSINGLCSSCVDEFDENVIECQLENDEMKNYEVSLLGFAQFFSQNYFQYMEYFNSQQVSNKIVILNCQNSKYLDQIRNQCVNGCKECEDCQFIFNQYQCVKCIAHITDINTQYSQADGICYMCPYPCQFCLQIDEDQILKYNPYFQITSESIGQARKCLVNYDDTQTYIDQKSGLIKPYSQAKKKKLYFSNFGEVRIQTISDGNYILQKSIQEYTYIYKSQQIEFGLLNNFYPLKKIKIYLQKIEIGNFGNIPINNITDFIMENLIYDGNDLTFQINSLFGVNVLIQNMTIKNWIPNNFLDIKDNSKLIIKQLTISNLNLLNFNFITISNFMEKYFLTLQDITFLDCYFNNSQFLTINQSYQAIIYINNLTFVRCKFYDSQFIQFKSDEIHYSCSLKHISFQNCSIQNSILFQFLATQNMILLEQITLNDVIFIKSTLFQINSETQSFNLKFINLELHQSIIVSYIFGCSSNHFLAKDLTINNLTYNQSNIFYFQPLQQTCILKLQIDNAKLTNIIQVYPFNSGSNYYLFFIQNSNVTIISLILQTNLVISLFELLENQNIYLENIFISSYSETLIDLENQNIFQNQYFFISNFDSLTINNIKIEQIQQLVDPCISIRSDDSTKKNVTINNFSLIKYTSFNQVKSLNSAIYIQIQSQSDILIQNCNFKNNFISFKFPNSDLFFSAIMKIKSPSSNISINNITFQNIQINNSSDTVIIIEANKILLNNIQVQNINNNETNLVKSMNGFGIFLCQFLNIQNSNFQNIDSILYGILYVSLNLDGEVHLNNCTFGQQQRKFVQILPYIGGVITVNGLVSHNLNLNISNVSAKLIITSQAYAFLNLIPSTEVNYIYLNQLNFEDVISYDNSLFKFDFSSNMKQNQVIIKNIFFNNSFGQSLTISTNQNLIFNSSNLVGIIKVSFCKLFITNFYYFGLIEQPLFNINDLQKIIITNIRISNSNLYNNFHHIVFISGTIQNNSIISNIEVSNLDIFSSLQSFININISSISSEIQIKNFFFQNIKCFSCQTGLLLVKLQNQRISLRNINIINSNCGANSCLQFFESKVIILTSKFIKLNFEKNGVLQFNNCTVSIKKSVIIHSYSFGIAGAIYTNNSTLLVHQLALVNNSALIGAGIYYEQQKTNEDNIQQILFFENYAKIGLSNIREQPDFLQLKMYNVSIKTIRSKTETIKIDSPKYFINSQQQIIQKQYLKVKSGQAVGEFEIFNKFQMQYLKNNISLQLEEFNQLGEKIIDSFQKKCSISQKKIKFSSNFNLSQIIPELNSQKTDIITFNISTNSYQLDSVRFYLNPYLEEQYQLLVFVNCETLDLNYYFTFYVRTYECENGEYFSFDEENPECKICDFEKGYFSVEKNSIECQRQDLNKIKNITYGFIELYEGFWRYSYNSYFIEECDAQNVCLGGWSVKDDSCQLGYIGAICNECDLYNIRGNSSHVKSLNGLCEKKEVNQTKTIILTVTLMLIIYFIAFIIARQKELMNRQYKIFKCYSLHYKILYKCNLDQLNTKIKLFIFLSQILYTLPTKRNNFDMSILFWPLGNSNKSLLQVINFLVDEFSLSIIYVKAIWATIIPMFHVSFIWFVALNFVKIFDRKKIVHFLQTGTIFFIFYSLPCVVEEHSYLVQARTLSSINWIGANISYLYDTQVHKKWIIYLILPSLLFCSILIPLLAFIKLFISNKQQNKNITQGLISYFCSDYKEKLYFQEILNHLIVTLIILIHSLFNESIVIFKTLLILIIVLMYYVEISIYQPYFNKSLNKTQKQCIFLICIYIVLSCLSQTSNDNLISNFAKIQNYIGFVMLLLIIAINFQNIIDTIIRLNFSSIDKIIKFISMLFPYLLKKYPKFLKSKVEIKENVKHRFKYLRTQFRVLRQHNTKAFKFNYNQIHEETYQAIYTTAIKSEQRILIQAFPPIQQSIIL